MGTRINVPAVVSVVHAKTTTTPVDPFDAQNNIGKTLNRYSVAMVVWQNNNSLPFVVAQNNNSLPNTIDFAHCGRAHWGTK
jgi:hypothetical protein